VIDRKLLAREAKALIQRIAKSKPLEWIVAGTLVTILSWSKTLIWRPWPDWLAATAMLIGAGLVAVGAIKWLLSLKAERTSGEG
jgi:hypothetical protein